MTTTTPGIPGAPSAAPAPSQSGITSTPAATSTTAVGVGAVPMDTTTSASTTTAASASATSSTTPSTTTAAAAAAADATTTTVKDVKAPTDTDGAGGDTVDAVTSAATTSVTATTPPATTSSSSSTTITTPTSAEKRKGEDQKPKARKQPKAPPTLPSIPSTFIPLRVDVSSNDKKTRVVDTLLFDPSCFPVPLYSPIAQAVEDNVREMAYQILSDAECYGMTRPVSSTASKGKSSSNAPSFVGRVGVYSPELQTKAEDQLRSQIWKILDGKMEILQKASSQPMLLPKVAPAAQSQPTTQEATPGTAVSSSTATTPASATSTATTPKNNGNNNGLVPISIRMHTVHRIIIHEDIWWDPVNSPLTVVEFARELAEELNLPNGDEAVIGITTCMLEQLYGLKMDDAPDVSAKVTQQIFFHNNPSSAVGSAGPHNSSSNNSHVLEASSSSKEGLRGAYQMSENNNRNAMSQFAKQHSVK